MIDAVILYFDGGIREGLMAYGYVALDPSSRQELFHGSRTCGNGTSNIAEYRALIAGLKGCLKKSVQIVHIIGDSQLIIKQVSGAYKVNKDILRNHRDHILELLEHFEAYSLQWVPRKLNRRADILVNQVFERRLLKCGTAKEVKKRKNKFRS